MSPKLLIVLRVVDGGVAGVIVVLYAGIVAAMFAQVLFRYVLGSPLSWSEEVSRYMFVWLCYLGAYVAVIRGAHVGVDYLSRHFSTGLRRALTVLFNLAIIGVLAAVAYQGAIITRDNLSAEWSTIPELSMALVYAAVPIGALLMILGFVRLTLGIMTAEPDGPGPETGSV